MSLELAIKENTEALRTMHALFAKFMSAAPAEQEPAKAPAVAAKPAKIDTPKVEAPKPVPTPTVSATATPAPTATAPAAPVAESPSKKVDYAAVKTAVLEVVKAKGADVAAKLLEEFGAKKGPDLKEDQYPAVLARATSMLAS